MVDKLSPFESDLYPLEKPRILYIPFGIKILGKTPCIVTVDNIYIFAGDLNETRIFQKIYKVYPRI
jgi:hypothetical protein